VCAADLDGNTIDVGTALISTGYAFAAMNTKGEAISTNYLIAEINAKMEHNGLWATTFQHPVQLLLKQAQERKK
jgi:endonuclease YncB( thermonuclease family)